MRLSLIDTWYLDCVQYLMKKINKNKRFENLSAGTFNSLYVHKNSECRMKTLMVQRMRWHDCTNTVATAQCVQTRTKAQERTHARTLTVFIVNLWLKDFGIFGLQVTFKKKKKINEQVLTLIDK